MKAVKLTIEQIKNDDKREYNSQVWLRNIDSYSKYADVQFFKVGKGNGYDYDRFFVSYTLPEGLKLFSDFGYSASLTNGGFQQLIINDFDIENMKLYDNNEVELIGLPINTQSANGGEIKQVWLNNSKEARKLMTERSKEFGTIWTKEGI